MRKAKVNKLTQGIDAMDIAATLGGWATAAMLPSYVIKDTSTTTNKWLKVAVAGGATLGMGLIAKKFLNAQAAKFLVAGGLAGVASQAIVQGTGYQIGNQAHRLPAGRPAGAIARPQRVGVPQVISPAPARGDETVSLITP